jgi:hypothetical protein
MLSTFFFGHAALDPVLGGGEPIYYNFMASTADMDHEDLVGGLSLKCPGGFVWRNPHPLTPPARCPGGSV